ncbi:polyhydroxyalkanoate depolymerase [Burkholderiales bacterium]|nr:polyhydroxyalkanoate depolymerase [Burkholderiales bacterium]
MLYTLHELQRSFLSPIVTAANVLKEATHSPFNPLRDLPFMRAVGANSELFTRVMQRYQKPSWDIETVEIDGKAVAVHTEVTIDKPFCKLTHFRKDTNVHGPKLLIVAPLSGHFATLLRDTVRTSLADHDVWVTDWVDAKMVPLSDGDFCLEDYVDYIKEFICSLTPNLNVMSVCQPTVPVLAAISLLASERNPCSPDSMIMMGGPIDARLSPTTVNQFADEHSHEWFANQMIMRVPQNYPGFSRMVYPGFMQHASFMAMNPDRHLNAHWEFYKHLMQGDQDSAEAHRQFYDEYNAVLDMPAEYYLDTVRVVFQDFLLPRGEWSIRGQRVDPGAIKKTALFTIEGELDDISGNGQTEAAQSLCSSVPKTRRKHLLAKSVGHYGIFSGRKFRTIIYPHITKFIQQQARSNKQSAQ